MLLEGMPIFDETQQTAMILQTTQYNLKKYKPEYLSAVSIHDRLLSIIHSIIVIDQRNVFS
jgi:hypothetical protein